MKRTLILFLFIIWMTFATLAGGKFYVVSSTTSTLDNIKNDKLTTTSLVVKQTYDCQNNIYTIVNTNNESTLAFSADVIVKLNDNSKLNIDSFEQLFNNINELPDIASYTTTNLNLSLFGSAQFNVKSQFTEENPMIVSTSMASIVIKSGKFIIRSEEKSLLLIVLEGEAIVLDSISKHKQVVKDKNMLVVVPAPKLQGRAAEHIKKQNMFSLKPLDDVDNKELTTEFTTLNDAQSNIKFIVVNKDVVGVKIR
jgi:hypothetical protein